MNKKNESIEKLTLGDWLNFLQNTKTTDIYLIIGSAGLVTAMFAVGFGIIVDYIEDITLIPVPILTRAFILLVIIILIIYYYCEVKPRHLSLKKIKPVEELIDDIISGTITEPQEIKEKWLDIKSF